MHDEVEDITFRHLEVEWISSFMVVGVSGIRLTRLRLQFPLPRRDPTLSGTNNSRHNYTMGYSSISTLQLHRNSRLPRNHNDGA